MKDEFVKEIGVWGQWHYNYLKKHSPTVINVMRMNGTLEQYLTNPNRLSNTFKTEKNVTISKNTIEKYIEYIEKYIEYFEDTF